MDRLTANYHALNTNQRIGLLAVIIIALTTSLCFGASCTAETSLLMGAGLGGAVGFALAAVFVAALLRWGIEITPEQSPKEDDS